MFRLVEVVAPRSLPDLVLKAGLLVLTFAVFDKFIGMLTETFRSGAPWRDFFVTYSIGAPFGVFVMSIMAYQRKLQTQLAQLAATDVLTGLPNRRSFMESASVLAQQQSENVVLLIDADHFKLINDTYGHDVGDTALIAISQHLQKQLRVDDQIGRIGGEEFAVLIPKATQELASAISQRICSTIEVKTGNQDQTVKVTLSVGAAALTQETDLAKALKAADEALYRAKENGRARVEWASDAEFACA